MPTFLSRVYSTRAEIPKGAEQLYQKRGTIFIRDGAFRDFVADNPWDADEWNLTAQGAFIEKHGPALAGAFAKIAGTTVGGLKPRPLPPSHTTQVIVQRRNVGVSDPPDGSSGDGPPV